MSSSRTESNKTAPTQFLETNRHTYAYRRLGNGFGLPLILLQHFTGTPDNWDPAVTDPLASGRDIILFDNAGVGRSTGDVPVTIAGMAGHAAAFLAGLGIARCDVLGYSLGGMVSANDCRTLAWTFSSPVTASGRSERPSSRRSSNSG